MNFLNSYELPILNYIQENLRCKFLDTVLPYITSMADTGIIWIIIAVILLIFRKTRKAGFMMGLALIMGLVVGNLTLKPLIARIRPYDVNPDVVLLINKLHDYSFPSGHTLASFEGAGVLMLTYRKKLGYPALVLAIIIAFSRMYLYVHYPTDVLAGLILGLVFAFASYKIVNAIYSAVEKKKAAAAD